ncbi:SH3 domain-containing protein [Rhizobium arsenicireducens]
MRQIQTFLFALSTLLLACGISTPSRAQGYDEACMRAVETLCGKSTVMRCFAEEAQWGKVPERCHGDVQSMFEAENNSAAAESATPAGGRAITPIKDLSALSYGGILRAGPSMDSKKKASIRLGQPIELIEATGIWTDDYQWFKVKTASGIGYHWGGIFCTMGGVKPEGVLFDCDENPPGSF